MKSVLPLMLAGALASLASEPTNEPIPRHLPAIVMPRQQVVLSAPLEGVLQDLSVEEGQRVVAGETLGRMDDRIARAAVDAAEAAAGRTADRDHAELELVLATKLLQRLEAVADPNAVSARQVEEAQVRRNQAQATLASAEEALEQARRNLELERRRLQRHGIVAPFDGLVTRVHTAPGATLTTSHEVLSVVDLSILEAELHLPAEAYARLETGRDYALEASSPVSRTLDGTLVFIDPVMEPATRTFRCVFRIANPDTALPAGFSVQLVGAR